MNIFSILGGAAVVAAAQEEVAAGVTKVQLLAALATGKKLINELIDLSNELADSKASDLVTDIAFAMQAIYQDFEKDPRDMDIAHNFVAYLAPRAVELATTYANAVSSGKLSAEDRASREKTLLDAVKTFEAFLARCLENDADGLEFQSESLARLLEMQTPILARKHQ